MGQLRGQDLNAAPAELVFIVAGDPQQLTGGYIYDARIVAGLRALGHAIDVIGLDGVFPQADENAENALDATLTALADGRLVIIDGLAMGRLPDVVARHADRLILVAVVHHPLVDETGLQAEVPAKLLALETRTLAAVRAVMVTSEFTAQRLAALGVRAARVYIVEPGVDAADIAAGSRDSVCRLLCVATVTPRKGHGVLVTALASLAHMKWQCECIGALDRNEAFASDVARCIERAGLGHRLRLRGALDGQSLSRAYAASGVLVLASHYEGYGMVIVEALAHGLPIVTTTGGALADTLPAGCGLAVPPGDAAALGDALAILISDQARRVRARDAAIAARARLRTWPQAADEFAAVLEPLSRDFQTA